MEKVRTRFAPSPTGFLHVGGLRTALYAYLYAKQNHGDFILRIEDTDQTRYVPGSVDVIYATLKDAKIIADEGPLEGGKYGPYIQSERKDIYLKYAKELVAKKNAYYCFCDKERLDKIVNKDGVKRYDKHCLSLSEEEVNLRLVRGDPWVIRQNIPQEGYSSFHDLVYGDIKIPNSELEDQILIKSDGMPTYNFANVIDDHLMHITHVMRGNEYLSSTPKYNFLYDAFGWERPQYAHLAPIMKDATRKLSKRYGDAHFADFIAKGYLPSAIVNYIALLGWSPKSDKEKFTIDELISEFSLDRVIKANAIFDENKMKWLNGEYIKEMPFSSFMEHALPFFRKCNINPKYDYVKLGKILQPRIDIFSEIGEKIAFLDDFHEFDLALFNNKRFKINKDNALSLLKDVLPKLAALNEWNEDKIREFIVKSAEELGIKSGMLYSILRLAISGVGVTPGGAAELADILGKDETLRRIRLVISWPERKELP